MTAVKGSHYTYSHPEEHGFGRMAKGSDLTAEMHELDLRHGMSAVVFDHDADTGWPIVQWTDTHGLERYTTIDPDLFERHFTETEA